MEKLTKILGIRDGGDCLVGYWDEKTDSLAQVFDDEIKKLIDYQLRIYSHKPLIMNVSKSKSDNVYILWRNVCDMKFSKRTLIYLA